MEGSSTPFGGGVDFVAFASGGGVGSGGESHIPPGNGPAPHWKVQLYRPGSQWTRREGQSQVLRNQKNVSQIFKRQNYKKNKYSGELSCPT